MRHRKTLAGAVALALLAAPAAAEAHVTVQPGEVPAGAFARMDVRVPNESDSAGTQKIVVEMPDGFIFASYEPVPGWSTQVRQEPVEEPVEAYGETYTEQVDTITWTADSPAEAIAPGEFRDFGLSVGVPEAAEPGDELAFPAIQTYDDGEVVRWIGDADSEFPASTVLVTEPDTESEDGSHATETAAAEPSTAEDSESSEGSSTVSTLALILGAVGLGVGGLALTRSRRP